METTLSNTKLDSPEGSGPERNVTVAVVDDDASVLTLVASVLADYRVVPFDRPASALEALKDGLRPDLIISDVLMPGMTGFEMHESVREHAGVRSVPFVYLTSMAERDDIRRGMAQGADDYLTKPFTPDDLRTAVRARLERSGVLRATTDDELLITSLGGLGIAHGATRLHWEARKAVELLLYLLDAGGSASVKRVRSELWFGVAAENHLHVLVSRLRKTLGEAGSVTMEDDVLRLRLACKLRWDARDFESLGRRALETPTTDGIELAIHAYAGDFLAGFDSPWSERRQTELQNLYMDLLEAAVEHAPTGATRERAELRLETFLDVDTD